MRPISRLGDINTTGGKIIRCATTVFAGNKPVGLHPSPITPHAPWGKTHPPHAVACTTTGSLRVFAQGAPVLRVGSGNTCGHSIITGYPQVLVP